MIRRLWTVVLMFAGAAVGWWLISRWLAHMAPEPIPEQGLKPAPPREVIPVEPAVHDDRASADKPAPSSTPAAETGEAPTAEEAEVRVYCLGCRARQPVRNVRYETTPQGRRRLMGECAVCGRKVSQFVKG